MFCFSLMFETANCKDIELQTVTVWGRRAGSSEVKWTSNLTLGKLVLLTGGLVNPGGPYRAEIRRILPDGTESRTTYQLYHLFDDLPLSDPSLQPGDRITFLPPERIFLAPPKIE